MVASPDIVLYRKQELPGRGKMLDRIEPLTLPPGMSFKRALRTPLKDRRWQESKLWLCLNCGRPAFYHPFTNAVWGCRRCGFTTDNIIKRFVSERELARRAAGREPEDLDISYKIRGETISSSTGSRR